MTQLEQPGISSERPTRDELKRKIEEIIQQKLTTFNGPGIELTTLYEDAFEAVKTEIKNVLASGGIDDQGEIEKVINDLYSHYEASWGEDKEGTPQPSEFFDSELTEAEKKIAEVINKYY